MSKSIMELINEAPVVEYDPSKGVTMKEISDTIIALSKIKPRKPEYILSISEAKELPLSILNWLGENYIVMCGLEAHNIVKERESIELK